jgi:hypothetical protein
MTDIQSKPDNPFIASGGFAALIQDLWDGKISENDFIKNAHQQGISATRIEWEIADLKSTDGVEA